MIQVGWDIPHSDSFQFLEDDEHAYDNLLSVMVCAFCGEPLYNDEEVIKDKNGNNIHKDCE